MDSKKHSIPYPLVEKNMKALIFDLDDTLLIEEASAKTAMLETCEYAKQKYHIEPADLTETLKKICRSFWHESPAREYCLRVGISSWEGLWSRFKGDGEDLKILREWSAEYQFNSWHHSLLQHGVDDREFAEELMNLFHANRRKHHVQFDDVIPALAELKKSFKLGLLTNGAPDIQREKITGSGIDKFFSSIVISGEVGVGKPNPAVFEIILANLNAAPGDTAMIGNSLKSDIQPCKTLGIKSVWLNRDRKENSSDIHPDLEVFDLYNFMENF